MIDNYQRIKAGWKPRHDAKTIWWILYDIYLIIISIKMIIKYRLKRQR